MKRKSSRNTLLFASFLTLVLLLSGCGTKQAAVTVEESAQEEATVTQEEMTEENTTKQADENAENVNLLDNGDFSKGTEHWATYITKGGVGEFSVDENQVGVFEITSTGSSEYADQIYYDGFALKMGGVYEFSFEIASTVPRSIEPRIQINGGDYHPYVIDTIDITSDMQTYTLAFTMTEGNDPAPRICFNLGTPIGGSAIEPHTVTIDNVSVKITDASNIVETVEVDNTVDCNTNQIGFLPDAVKTVVIRSEKPGTTFKVLDENKKEVYTGTLSEAIDSVNAKETVYRGDFSDFTAPGSYTIQSEDGAESYPFTIGENIYEDLKKDTFRMLYLQRCGMELTTEKAGDFAHPICHDTDAVIYGTDITKDVSGGWHDAGDYGRYVVTGAETVEDLFLAYEDYPDVWDGADADALEIPESGNGIPDILDEARYELDWLLKMQDEAAGGVYHKVTCKEFPEFIMPQEETGQLVLAPISTTATADFAAIMAKSSVVYEKYDPDFAGSCLKAAKKAWEYLEKTDNVAGYKNPEDILTGEYPDGQDKDERFWASVELYKVTGDAVYQTYMEETMEKYILQGFGWAEMGSYGNIAYLTMEDSLKNPAYEQKMKEEIVKKADKYLANVEADGYRVALGNSYIWGSNMLVCNQARQLLLAELVSGKEEYGAAAYDQLQYLLGENTLSYCFVTGYGSLSPQHVHHRPSMATGAVMKGMLAGGPDSALEDPFVKSTMADVAPAKCYVDNDQSYSTNEVTIYWNSPFIYLLSSQMSEKQ